MAGAGALPAGPRLDRLDLRQTVRGRAHCLYLREPPRGEIQTGFHLACSGLSDLADVLIDGVGLADVALADVGQAVAGPLRGVSIRVLWALARPPLLAADVAECVATATAAIRRIDMLVEHSSVGR